MAFTLSRELFKRRIQDSSAVMPVSMTGPERQSVRQQRGTRMITICESLLHFDPAL